MWNRVTTIELKTKTTTYHDRETTTKVETKATISQKLEDKEDYRRQDIYFFISQEQED